MNVAFRVDASVIMGSGHVMRCLTLAEELVRQGARIFFICRTLQGNMCDFLEKKGYTVYRLPYQGEYRAGADRQTIWSGETWQVDAGQTRLALEEIVDSIDWLIVDHYGLDNQWEKLMRPIVENIMVIDDLADRQHDCDILLDQNLYFEMGKRYNGLLPAYCKKLLGPQYALLRPEFYEARDSLRLRSGNVERVLIFFGGSDPTNETSKALTALQRLPKLKLTVDVVVGSINPHRDQIRNLCRDIPGTIYHCQVSNMAALMAQADLAIGGGGSTTWERCYLGLPAITLVLAKNQEETSKVVAEAGASMLIGWHTAVSEVDIAEKIIYTVQHPEVLREMANIGFQLTDASGGERSVETIVTFLKG